MPLEIRELIIRARVEPATPPRPSPLDAQAVEELRAAIVQEALERVELLLAEKRGR